MWWGFRDLPLQRGPFLVSFASRLEWARASSHLPSPLLPLVLPLPLPFSSSPSGPSSSFSSPSTTSCNRARLCVLPPFLVLAWGGDCSPGLFFRLPLCDFSISHSVPASSGMIDGTGCTGVRSRRHYWACRSSFSCGASGWVGMPSLGCRVVSVALDVVGCVIDCCLVGWRLRRRVFGDPGGLFLSSGPCASLDLRAPLGPLTVFPSSLSSSSSTSSSASSLFHFCLFL